MSSYTLSGGAGGVPGQAGSDAPNIAAVAAGNALADYGGILVTSNADDGSAGTLRSVLARAPSGAIIRFDPSVFTGGAADVIDLTSTLQITRSVTIEGAVGGGKITLDGQNAVGIVNVAAGTTDTLDGLIIQNGNATATTAGAAAAGGIFDAGSLTLTNSVVRNNTAIGADGGNGGIGAYGVSTASGGAAGGGAAGGVYVASGAVLNVDATDAFTGNQAAGGGGGIGGVGGNYYSGNPSRFAPGGSGGSGGFATSAGTSNKAATPGGDAASTGAPGGMPGQPGGNARNYDSGGGGGGNAFGDYGGNGRIVAPVVVQPETAGLSAGATTTGTDGTGGTGALASDRALDLGTLSLTSVTGSGAAQPLAAGSTSTSNATAVTGTFGTLTIGADGSYSYAAGNGLAIVTAADGSPITDTFSDQVTSTASGVSANSSLAITTSLAAGGTETVNDASGSATYSIGATTLTLNETAGTTYGGVIQDGSSGNTGGKLVVSGGAR